MTKFLGMIATVAVLGSAGCGKRAAESPAGERSAEQAPAAIVEIPVATHLGFATRVPADADMFFAGYGADEMIGGWAGEMIRKFGGDPADDPALATEKEVKLREMMLYLGDEAFVFVGPGTGGQLEMLGTSYRELSAAWGGFAVGQMLDMAANQNFDMAEMEDGLSDDFADKWLDALEKNSRLQVPSVVMGWRPDPGKLDECRDALVKGIQSGAGKDSQARPVRFEANGCELAGIEFPGSEVFEEFLAKARQEFDSRGSGAEALEMISPERFQRLLAALDNVKFTVAAGSVDGRVVIYLGNGAEGFRLAATPEESLAASAGLRWSAGFAERAITGVAYLSEPMVRAALPWLDTSDYWEALSDAVRPPVREQRLFRDLLADIATSERQLARRDASAWSAVLMRDDGWQLESRGGWPDPGLDYAAPLKMTDAAVSRQPAIRAHWVQSRDRNDLEWRQLEQFGLLFDAGMAEFQTSGNAAAAMVPEGVVPRLMEEIRGLNATYRDEFRAGVGDEVAVVMDFQGEMPPVPGVAEETLAEARVPRFIVARPVTDRAMLDAAGGSLAERWKGLTAWASELSGNELPLILPQSVESNGLVTWYPPLPFIGGDFLPGVSLNDDVWMLGTSREMAGGFAKAMATPGSGGDTGVIVEIDFEPLRQWLADLYRRNQTETDGLAGDAPDAVKELASEENREHAIRAARRLDGLSYRHWLEDGEPRTRIHLRLHPAE